MGFHWLYFFQTSRLRSLRLQASVFIVA